jgi:hypothetical protein
MNRNGNGNGTAHDRQGAAPAPDAAQQFIIDAKKLLLPALVRDIPGKLFEAGQEEVLKKRVAEIVDEYLRRDKIPIGRQLRLKLLESIFADIERARRDQRSGEA